jgi:alkylation response protein AidB-like acyl-CoA dehydrogenase
VLELELSEEQRAYRDAVVAFARRDLADGATRDADGMFSRDAWRGCARLGILGLPVPTEFGGQGADATTTVLALEALGYGCRDSGLIFSLNAQMWACETPLVQFGTDGQRRKYLPGLCDGSLIAAHAMTEPGSGSDAYSLTTVARREGGRYILDGAKTFVTNGPRADLFVVFAATEPGLGFMGISGFLVERDSPGLTVGQPLRKMGLQTSPMSELFLESCAVSADQLLGAVGAGASIFNTAMDWERSCILASTVGTMERELDHCVAYARERRQFGQPIGSFQAVSHRIVDMKLRLETSRLLLYRVSALLDRGAVTPLDAALTKLYLSESFLQSSLDAVATHGGYGYMHEYGFEADVRDAVGARIYSGTSDMLRNIVARHMGL